MNGSNEHSAHERAAMAMLGEVLIGAAGLVVVIALAGLTADWWSGMDVMSQLLAKVAR